MYKDSILEFFVSLRYLSGRKMGFVSVITIISIIGVMLGTLALVLTLSIANGFQQEIIDNVTGTLPNVQMRKYWYKPIDNPDSIETIIKKYPGVKATSRSIEGKSVIEFNDPRPDIRPMQEGVKVHAINDSAEVHVTDVSKKIVQGEWSLDSAMSYKKRMNPAIIVGEELVREFGRVTLGSELIMMSSSGDNKKLSPTPKMMRFTVTGIFKTGMYEYDKLFTYISVESGKKLFDLENVQYINFRCDDPYDAADIADSINVKLGPNFKHADWKSRHASLFEWMEFEKVIGLIVISLIILVAAFNIVSTLMLMIMEKRREIGILMSMGASRIAITKIFLYHGVIIGLIGSTLGSIIGIGTIYLQDTYHFFKLSGNVYFVDHLPVLLEWKNVLIIFITANIICIGAAAFPAWLASKILPADAVRID